LRNWRAVHDLKKEWRSAPVFSSVAFVGAAPGQESAAGTSPPVPLSLSDGTTSGHQAGGAGESRHPNY
jgi:hypothetical protein